MFRKIALSTIAAFAFISSAHAGTVQVNFSGGSGTPLTITLPQSVSYTVVTGPSTLEVTFVFQGTGNMFSGTVGAGGSLSFTRNAGSPFPINDAQQFNAPPFTLNDLSLYASTFPVTAINVNDVFLLSAGSVTTTTNIAAAAPASGLYSTILTDGAGHKMGDGTAVPEPGDYNHNGIVDAADYVLWRKSPSTYGGDPAGYTTWRSHFGQPPGSGSARVPLALPAPPFPSQQPWHC